MKQYPSIPHFDEKFLGRQCIGFTKYDGSCIRAEWSMKKGFYKFGTRDQLLSPDDPIFAQAQALIQGDVGLDVVDTLKATQGKLERLVAYFEFFSNHPDCFAGTQLVEGEKFVKLIDVSIYRKGFMTPQNFVKVFEHKDYCAEPVFEGRLTQDEVQHVMDGEGEGVVYKGGESVHKIWRCKVKSRAWKNELIRRKGNDWERLF
ncbi:hypothetical protein N9137_00835 [Pseudomonadales bacterium]|nr:hypothetical protein [Pseudomonadales bacterium]